MNFNSINELRDRVDPALDIKEKELKDKGYNITKDEIWSYLASNIFPNTYNLTLYDVVKYIMNFDENTKV